MNRKLISLFPLMTLTAATAPAEIWTNALADNDFANWGNWIVDAAPATNPTSWSSSTNNWQVNLTGADKAILVTGQTVAGVNRNVLVGDGESAKAASLPTGQVGELLIDGGSLGITRNLRLGRDTDTGSGVVTVTNGGTLNVGYGLFVGQNANAGSSFNLLDGTVNVSPGRTDGLLVAHFGGGNGTLNISGGNLNVKGGNAVFASESVGGTPASATLNLSGTGAMTVENGDVRFGGNTGLVTANVSIADSASLTAGAARFGFGADSTVSLDMTGGTFSVPTGFATFGQAANALVAVTMSAGIFNADRMVWANDAAAAATLAMTGGTINLVRSGTSTSTTTGGFAMGPGNSDLDVGGTAVINMEKLYIAAGGVMTVSGGAALNIAGSTDGVNPTFDFSSAFLLDDWTSVLGKLVFDGGTVQVAGSVDPVDGSLNYATLLNAAISQGVITTTVPGMVPLAQYNGVGDYTELVMVVPEPAAIGLAMAGAVLLLALRRRRRR